MNQIRDGVMPKEERCEIRANYTSQT